MLNVSKVLLNPKFLEVVNIERAIENDGEYQNMEFVRSEPEVLQIMASVQQADAADIRKLPEGERTREAKSIYSVSEIRETKDDQVADKILDLQGKDWKVQSVEHWQNYGYYHAVVTAS